ncbi:MAG: ATP-binding protein [Tenacibaculum sp.]
MTFKSILGQKNQIDYLKQSVEKGVIPHAQLFVGKEGSGALPLAVAYAQYILCRFSASPKACAIKCEKLQHPDLHFAFPVSTTKSVKSHPTSSLFLKEWRLFYASQPYGNLFNWFEYIGIENKQGLIGVDQAKEIVKTLQLKSYEGGFKIMIIWMAEKMNIAASNKLLKLIEEPPDKTVFILVVEDEGQVISTIKSRCQALHFPALSQFTIANALIEREKADKNEALKIAFQAAGSYNKALYLLHQHTDYTVFENWIINWVRSAFMAKTKLSAIQNLIEYSETIAIAGRETQKQFLQYCLQFFRQALLLNYGVPELVIMQIKNPNFRFSKFAPFVHGNNVIAIEKELSEAQYHIERNGNAKIILLDLSIKLTRLLHIKEK